MWIFVFVVVFDSPEIYRLREIFGGSRFRFCCRCAGRWGGGINGLHIGHRRRVRAPVAVAGGSTSSVGDCGGGFWLLVFFVVFVHVIGLEQRQFLETFQVCWRFCKDNYSTSRQEVTVASKSAEAKLNYKEALQKNTEMKLCPQNKMLQVSNKEDISRWQCSVVCKRKSIKSSWIEISKEISAMLDKEVVLYPFQCNKAMLFAAARRRPEWVARHKKITVNIKDEASLRRWKQKCNFHGKRKFVSFGGWIEIEGLPFSLWNKETFKQIGDACGGYLQTDYRTENFLSLFVARIKVRTNEHGLIPEFVDVIGNFEALYVRINPATVSNCRGFPWRSSLEDC
ncbi:hypothetical protein M0R45_016306 [Rubus argutus]|uniref:DUF4283 domain-containing protein n=1 Tax=Rubus argutus TaxID=59490 RepID=A0AAW1XRJ4_RUBAR